MNKKHKEKQVQMRKNVNHKPLKLPKKFKPGFLATLDKRTEIYNALQNSYLEIVSDMGGAETLSHTKRCLVERFVFLEFVLRRWESRFVRYPKKSAHLIGKWVQGVNSLSGLAKTIGLQRRAKKVTSLQVYARGEEE